MVYYRLVSIGARMSFDNEGENAMIVPSFAVVFNFFFSQYGTTEGPIMRVKGQSSDRSVEKRYSTVLGPMEVYYRNFALCDSHDRNEIESMCDQIVKSMVSALIL